MDELEREHIVLENRDIHALINDYFFEEEEYEEDFDENLEIIGDPVWNQYKIVSDEIDYTDLSKGYEERTFVIQRKSDDKYFAGSYIHSPYAGNDYTNDYLYEVFPVEKTIIKFI